MKQSFIAVLIIAALASCKKDTDTPSTPAELTITASDLSKDYAPGKSVALFSVNVAASPALKAPVEGQGQTWDFSTLAEEESFQDICTATTGTSFPSNGYFLPNNTYFADGTLQTLRSEFEVGDSGWVRRGVALPAFTLNFPDYGATIKYEAQDSKYSSLLPLTTPFPVKYNAAGEFANVVRTENFSINAPALGLNNTPASQKYTNSQSLKCMAAGKLTLKGFAKAMDVLVIKAHRKIVYNYFVGGAPAPKQLLDVLGITDGTTTDYYWYDFFNPGGEGYLGTISVTANNTVISASFKKK